jgi:polyisoprenoid-binding protein YceI
MKKIIFSALIVAFTAFSAFAIFSNWKVKGDEAQVTFEGHRVSGSFSGLKADIIFDKEHPEQAKISATIDVTTAATGFFIKTSHVKSALGADDYPTIKFESTSVSKNGSGYVANGKLTMKGKTNPESIHFTFEDKGNEGLFKGDFKVLPPKYGIDRSGTPPEVTIHLTVPVTKG